MAQKYHPDKTGGKTDEKFKEIQGAYDVLSDKTQRDQWEAARSGYSGYDDFGGQRTNWNQRTEQQNHQQTYNHRSRQQQQRQQQQQHDHEGDFYGFRQHQRERQNPYGHEQRQQDTQSGHQQYRKTTYRDAKGKEYTFYNTDNFDQRQQEEFNEYKNHQQRRGQRRGESQDPLHSFFDSMNDMFERQKAHGRDEQNFQQHRQRDNQKESAEQYRERMRREGQGDPFNTPFENWYHEQKQDPYSEVNSAGRYMRILLWGTLFLVTIRFLGGLRQRREQKTQMKDEYLRQAESERMRHYAGVQQQLYTEHVSQQQQWNDGRARQHQAEQLHRQRMTQEEIERERRMREQHQAQYRS